MTPAKFRAFVDPKQDDDRNRNRKREANAVICEALVLRCVMRSLASRTMDGRKWLDSSAL